jgi:hypothetical protein
MNFIAIDKEGHHCGFSNRANTQYAYITESMDVPSQIDRTVVPIQQRWQKSHSNNAEDDNIKEVK